jgi:hypothetical protein
VKGRREIGEKRERRRERVVEEERGGRRGREIIKKSI